MGTVELLFFCALFSCVERKASLMSSVTSHGCPGAAGPMAGGEMAKRPSTRKPTTPSTTPSSAAMATIAPRTRPIASSV
jgi:hypothetical protein